MSDRIDERVIAVIAESQHIARESVTLDSTLEELGIDSLGALDVVFGLENEFGVTLSDADALVLRTVRQAVELLERVAPAARPTAAVARG
jgi:acyl carrier protein